MFLRLEYANVGKSDHATNFKNYRILYIVTFTWTIRYFLQARKDGRFQQYGFGGTSATANTTPTAFPSTTANPTNNTCVEVPKMEAPYPQQYPQHTQQHPQQHPQELPSQLA
jgi:hypothetical protein